MDSVTADGIYDTKGCHGAIAARGADAVRALSRTDGVRALTTSRDEMPGPGKGTIPARRRKTKRYVPPNGSDGPTGRNGPDITDEVAWKPR
ncbi:hypothetical protein [Paenirhodobacter populi]|uniref:hypothetical protein n=1 Tax=Paenirhodobacter populi TaxID=2306993 RepID=UPI00361700B3